MKKILLIAILIVAAAILAACGSDDDTYNNGNGGDEVVSSPENGDDNYDDNYTEEGYNESYGGYYDYLSVEDDYEYGTVDANEQSEGDLLPEDEDLYELDADERQRRWVSDITQLREHVFATHPKFNYEGISGLDRNIVIGEAFDARLNDLISSIEEYTDFEMLLGIQRALSVFNDGHLQFHGQGRGRSFLNSLRMERFPLKFQWMGDGLYLLMAHERFAAALNHRLVSINDIAFDDIYSAFNEFFSIENIYHARDTLEFHINRPGILHALGITDGDDATFAFATADGGIIDISLTQADAFATANFFDSNWHDFDGIVYSRAAGEPLLLSLNPGRRMWLHHFEDYGILYIRFEVFLQVDAGFSGLTTAVRNILQTYELRAVIIDARNNGGGDHDAFMTIFQLAAEHAPPGMLFYFMNESTFSAAAVAAGIMYGLGATLVGQPSGQNIDIYYFVHQTGDVPYWVRLSYANYTVAVPNRFQTRRDVGIDTPDLILRPHVLIETTIDDWINNRDPLFEYVLGLLEDE